jgi:hypothetical protein
MGVMMDKAQQLLSELMQRLGNVTASISKKKRKQDEIEPMAWQKTMSALIGEEESF